MLYSLCMIRKKIKVCFFLGLILIAITANSHVACNINCVFDNFITHTHENCCHEMNRNCLPHEGNHIDDYQISASILTIECELIIEPNHLDYKYFTPYKTSLILFSDDSYLINRVLII